MLRKTIVAAGLVLFALSAAGADEYAGKSHQGVTARMKTKSKSSIAQQREMRKPKSSIAQKPRTPAEDGAKAEAPSTISR